MELVSFCRLQDRDTCHREGSVGELWFYLHILGRTQVGQNERCPQVVLNGSQVSGDLRPGVESAWPPFTAHRCSSPSWPASILTPLSPLTHLFQLPWQNQIIPVL